MDYYSAIKRTELSSHKKAWRILKCILLSEKVGVEKAPTIQFQLYDILGKARLRDNKIVVDGDLGEGGMNR